MEIPYDGPLSTKNQPEVRRALKGSVVFDLGLAKKAVRLQESLEQLLRAARIKFVSTKARPKSPESIRFKLQHREHPDWPISDLIGIRILIDPFLTDKSEVVEVIQKAYPMPGVLPWGMDSLRQGPTEKSDLDYNITRMNILYRGESDKPTLAEIQIADLFEELQAMQTHSDFKRRKAKNITTLKELETK